MFDKRKVLARELVRIISQGDTDQIEAFHDRYLAPQGRKIANRIHGRMGPVEALAIAYQAVSATPSGRRPDQVADDARRVLRSLTYCEVDGSLESDTRLMMRNERDALAAAIESASPKLIEDATNEALRVAAMWDVAIEANPTGWDSVEA